MVNLGDSNLMNSSKRSKTQEKYLEINNHFKRNTREISYKKYTGDKSYKNYTTNKLIKNIQVINFRKNTVRNHTRIQSFIGEIMNKKTVILLVPLYKKCKSNKSYKKYKKYKSNKSYKKYK